MGSERIAPTLIEELLTPSELRVALEVAQGATSREVAAALFVSRRTVEAHLGHVYRKLGLRSRSQLARLVALNERRQADGDARSVMAT
jgi:DNA-binding CsgD family transcriptional regulator